MVSLLAIGNGVYNRDGVVIDYNGRQGHHPKGCNCVKGHINKAAGQINPQTITEGVNPVVNQQNLTFEQFKQQQAYEAYLAANSGNQSPSNVLPENPNPNPPVVINPIVPEFTVGQTEYVIPLNIDLSGKPDSMAKLTDARVHAEPKFKNGIHDFRFPKGYASRSIVSEGVWALKLFRVS